MRASSIILMAAATATVALCEYLLILQSFTISYGYGQVASWHCLMKEGNKNFINILVI
jgi:hypothetical protein